MGSSAPSFHSNDRTAFGAYSRRTDLKLRPYLREGVGGFPSFVLIGMGAICYFHFFEI
jgi:hypothetical protein